MDKRTGNGKKFNELETSEEKILFLLEVIYDKLNKPNSSNYILR
jgi:hypothetical protein